MNLKVNENYNPLYNPKTFLNLSQYKHIKEADLITTDEFEIEYFRGSEINIIGELQIFT